MPFFAKISHNNYVAPPKSAKSSIATRRQSTAEKQASKSGGKEDKDKDAAADAEPLTSAFDTEKYRVPEFLKFEQIKNRFGLERGFVAPKADEGDKASEASSEGSKKAVDVVEMLALEEGRIEQ